MKSCVVFGAFRVGYVLVLSSLFFERLLPFRSRLTFVYTGHELPRLNMHLQSAKSTGTNGDCGRVCSLRYAVSISFYMLPRSEPEIGCRGCSSDS
jgi:hypothetical protein